MNDKPRRVLIIGGGVAGPALALFLKRTGIESELYEAYPFTEDVGGGFGPAPNAIKVLAALGLADVLKRQATAISRFTFINDRGADAGQLSHRASRVLVNPCW
jgi:2-polyprenyl-6-methoxyphenol hydroxylase-like FAD-dependent oxidoreductase